MTDPASPPDPGLPGTTPAPAAAPIIPGEAPGAADRASATAGPVLETAAAGPEPGTELAVAGEPGSEEEPVEAAVDAAPAGLVRLSRLARGPALRQVGGYGAATLAGVVLTAVVLLGFGIAGGKGGSDALGPTPAPAAGPDVTGSPPAPSAPASTKPAAGMVLGNEDAPVAVEIWADFQCPYCALLARGIEPSIVRAYVDTGEASLTYHDFAFLGQESVDAAAAARCASDQGEFWRYHDLLYAFQQGENQGAFSADVLNGMAGFAGLDQAAFATCLAAGTAAGEVSADTTHGTSLGVSSTPTLRFVGPVATLTLRGVPQWEQIVLTMNRVTGRAPLPEPSNAASSTPANPAPGASEAAAPAVSPEPAATPAP